MFLGHDGADEITLARVRAIGALVAAAVGLTVAREWAPASSGVLLAGAGVLGAIAGVAGWAWSRALLLAAVALGMCGWGMARWHERPEGDVAVLVEGERAVVVVEGVMLGDAERVGARPGPLGGFVRSEPGVRFAVGVDRVLRGERWADARGGLWVQVRGSEEVEAHAGQRVRVTGVFTAVEGPRNPGERDARVYAAERGMSGTLAASSAELVRVVEPARGWGAVVAAGVRWREGARERARGVLSRAAGEDASGERESLLRALLLGEFDPAREELRESFARTGLAHVLSISGFHIVVLCAFLAFVARALGERGIVPHVVVAGVLVAYLALVVPSAPVVRSVVMALVLSGVEWSGRRYDRVTVLAWVVLGLLVWRPLDLWSLGFQLSAGLTGLLLWVGPRFHERLFPARLRGLTARPVTLVDVVMGALRGSVSTSLLCTVASAPLVMMRVGVVTPIAAVASVVVSPLVVVVLFVAYGAMLVGMCVPAAAGVCGGVLGGLTDLLLWVVRGFEGMPVTTLPVPPVGAMWTAAATGVAVWLMVRRVRAWAGVMAVVGLAGWLGVGVLAREGEARRVAVRFDALDVGDGTCILVRSGGRAVLWDCGALTGGDGAEVVRACRALGVWRVPLVVVTHPDIDHFGLLPRVARDLGVREVVTSERFVRQVEADPRGAAGVCAGVLHEMGVRVRAVSAGATLTVGEAEMRVVSPSVGAAWTGDNDHSLVVAVTHPGVEGTVAVLCGDVQDEAVSALRLMDLGRPLVMEAPHHGSARGPAISWVGELLPAVVLQSSGASRLDDARWAGVRERVVWWSTAASGACWVEVERGGSVKSGAWMGNTYHR